MHPETDVARRSPLLPLHEEGEGLLSPYGPADAPQGSPLIVEAFDPVSVEYAALRTSCGLFDAAHRATLVMTGPERIDFLNRMLTQELKGFEPFTSRRAFWLNRKGRIDADLRLTNLPDRTLIDVDIHAAERTLAGLDAFIITEDCAIADATAQHHRLSLHGPGAAALLGRAADGAAPAGAPAVSDLRPGQATIAHIAGAEVVVDRHDTTGEIGLELTLPIEHVRATYEALSTPWSARPRGGVTPASAGARRIGWHAVNIARIEAGTALYYTDFGPDSLPHECGEETLKDRVSFTKGCYLGQEVVARMQSLGHPKQRLVGLRIDPPSPSIRGPLGEAPQAVTGTPVLAADSADALAVGAVTSSCTSPMLGDAPIALAMVKWAHAQEGTPVWLRTDGAKLHAKVQTSLAFWRR